MTRDLLAPAGNTAKFETIGQVHKGLVVSREQNQQRDFATGTPKTWDDGSPMMQVVIGLKVDGEELPLNLYVKGNMLRAVREAVAKAGAQTVEVGGTLAIKYTADGEAKPGLNPPKLFQAQYKPPTTTAGDLLADQLGAQSAAQSSVTADNLI